MDRLFLKSVCFFEWAAFKTLCFLLKYETLIIRGVNTEMGRSEGLVKAGKAQVL